MLISYLAIFPKSLSILGILGGDKRLIDAHNKTVKEMVGHLESKYAATRIKAQGKVSIAKSDNLAVATFKHTDSRELDPNLLEAAFYDKPFKFSYSSMNKVLTSPGIFYKEYVLKNVRYSMVSTF